MCIHFDHYLISHWIVIESAPCDGGLDIAAVCDYLDSETGEIVTGDPSWVARNCGASIRDYGPYTRSQAIAACDRIEAEDRDANQGDRD